MAEIIDLDQVLGAPKKVRLKGKVYLLPAQIPVPLYLSFKSEKPGDDLVEQLHDEVIELFRVHQPDLKVLPCGIGQLFEIIPLVYGSDEEKKALSRTTDRTGSGRPKNSRPRAKSASRS